MANALKQLMEQMRAVSKSSHRWTRGAAFPQSFYTCRNGKWEVGAFVTSTQPSGTPTDGRFTVLSWNIDFMRSFTKERMSKALAFLHEYQSTVSKPAVIMLNEMLVSDLALIQDAKWVQDHYYLTDVSSEFWESGFYGTCVLIPKSLLISKVFRVHYEDTAMERDGLFVDIAMSNTMVRICCTHLESLVAYPPKRPSQLATAARFMHEAPASILGGDLNAIEPFDKTLHSDNNLKDAYLETGGQEGAETGMTWGQMAPTIERNKFGLSRMDKLMFCGTIEIDAFETFGMDIVVDDERISERLIANGLEKPWVTDHLGVRGDFRVSTAAKAIPSL